MTDRQPATPSSRGKAATSSDWMAALHLGWTMIGSVCLGLAIGYGIDRWLGIGPWGMVGGSLLFLAAGVYLVIREGSR